MQILNQLILSTKPFLRLLAPNETCIIKDLETLPPFDNLTGVCVNVETCKGFATPGYCLGTTDIQCCTKTFALHSNASTNVLSDFGLRVLEEFEGYSDKFYCDISGNPPSDPSNPRHCLLQEGRLTIGWGHVCNPESSCDWIMTPFAQVPHGDKLKMKDVEYKVGCVTDQVSAIIRSIFTQNQFDALVEFAFDEGCEALENVTTILNAWNWGGAMDKLQEYNKSTLGAIDPNLVTRRAIEVNWFWSY